MFDKNKGRGKVIGVTATVSFLSFVAMAIFVKALGVKYDDFFTTYVDWFLYGSLGVLLFLVIIGAISITAIISKGRGEVLPKH